MSSYPDPGAWTYEVRPRVQPLPGPTRSERKALLQDAQRRARKVHTDGRRMPRRCTPKKRKMVCEAGHTSEVDEGCSRRACATPCCARHTAAERGRRVRAGLGLAGDCPWGVAVLTVPAEVRPALLSPRKLAQGRALAWRVVREWCEARGVVGDVGGVVLVHPEGDTKPGTWAPHFNVLWPCRAVVTDSPAVTGWREFPAHVPPAALEDLRARWRAALAEWSGAALPETVQVFYEWRKAHKKQRHAARYFARGFAAWDGWTHRVVWYGVLATNQRAGLPPPPDTAPSDDVPTCPVAGCGAALVAHIDAGLVTSLERARELRDRRLRR